MSRLLYFLPHHAISRFVGWLANRRWRWLKNWAIAHFIGRYRVSMTDAMHPDYRRYPTFNAFFTRHLKTNARPIASEPNAIISPVDGAVSEVGQITADRLLQAKNKTYTVASLLGGDANLAKRFHDGAFCTLYLAPKDYHRIHMPFDGTLKTMTTVPGRLFSVNPFSVNRVKNLFARNERVVCVFETAFGEMVMVIVGAMIVGSINVVWEGPVMSTAKRQIKHFDYSQQNIAFKRGDELGHFKLGSTVIMLFPHDVMQWNNDLHAEQPVRMGEMIASQI